MYIIYDDFYLKHDTGLQHPESPERLSAIIDSLQKWDGKEKLKFTRPKKAEIGQIEYVHRIDYVKKIYEYSKSNKDYMYLDPDTVVSKYTYECALLAAGGAVKGIDLILNKQEALNTFFALVRPPGHHSFPTSGSGFCIFNNVAVAAVHAIKNYDIKKVAIIDFDVHHGNGIQDIFYKSPSVFYISFHQYPHYPGTGFYDETGVGEGEKYNLNFPFAPLTGEEEYLLAIHEIVIPLLEKFKPGLILVSAGYDSHSLDPLSSMALESTSYHKLMRPIKYLSKKYSGGKLGILLEGGYNTKVIGESVIQTIRGSLENMEDFEKFEYSLKKAKKITDRNKKLFKSIKNIFGVN